MEDRKGEGLGPVERGGGEGGVERPEGDEGGVGGDEEAVAVPGAVVGLGGAGAGGWFGIVVGAGRRWVGEGHGGWS